MTKQEHLRFLYNSKAEISMRLEAIINRHTIDSVPALCREIDEVIRRTQQIKHSLIFLKNLEKAET